MAVRDDRSDVKQTTTGFRGPLMVQSLTSAKSKFLSLYTHTYLVDVLQPIEWKTRFADNPLKSDLALADQ